MRLIDADRLKRDMEREERESRERIEAKLLQLNEEGLRKVDEYVQMLLRMPEYRKGNREMRDLLDRQPTAYDVGGVVKRLEEKAAPAGEGEGPFVTLSDAVKIVKSGGR